jgi:hypothetical protein
MIWSHYKNSNSLNSFNGESTASTIGVKKQDNLSMLREKQANSKFSKKDEEQPKIDLKTLNAILNKINKLENILKVMSYGNVSSLIILLLIIIRLIIIK